jgi:hypothetical protein
MEEWKSGGLEEWRNFSNLPTLRAEPQDEAFQPSNLPVESAMNWQRLLPTVASIAIILIITALRDRSRTLAAIIAVTPINIPLALWIVSGATGDDSVELAHFTWSLLLGLIPVFLWVLIAFLAFRLGWSLWAVFGLAYLVWAVLLGLGFAIGWLSFK